MTMGRRNNRRDGVEESNRECLQGYWNVENEELVFQLYQQCEKHYFDMLYLCIKQETRLEKEYKPGLSIVKILFAL